MNPIDIIKSSHGKFVKVVYTNKTGVTKNYTCRMGVKKHLHGGTKFFIPNSITVFSVTVGNTGYKTFVKDQIQTVKYGTVLYNKQ
jgi:hypothetical protein